MKIVCKSVWLIDDDKMANYYNEFVLRTNEFASEIRSFTSAKEALEELKTAVESNQFPDFIFLDLNMPVMDGWKFLEMYRQFSEEDRESCTLYILSSSVDEEEIKKSKLNKDVRDFLSKPLEKKDLEVVKFQANLNQSML